MHPCLAGTLFRRRAAAGGGDPTFGALGTIVSKGSTAASSMTSTLTNIAVGDLVLAFVQRDFQSEYASVTCAGTAMTRIARHETGLYGDFFIDVYGLIATSASSSASIVVSYNSSAQWGTMLTARWTDGVASATPAQVEYTSAGGVGLPTATTNRRVRAITTTARSLIIVAGTDWNDYYGHTPASGWTERADGSGTPVTSIQFVFDRVSDAGTYGGAVNISTATNDQYMAIIMAFELG